MSYILDALKKQQAEQNPDAIAISMAEPRSLPRWLIVLMIVIAVLLVVNLTVFTIQALNPQSSAASGDRPADTGPINTSSKPETQLPNLDQPLPNTKTLNTQAPTTEAPKAKAQTDPGRQTGVAQAQRLNPVASAGSTEPTPQKQPVRPAAPIDTRPKVIERLNVSELSSNEQLAYNALNFTSHIYTDAPEDRAIVVDGYRLTTGEAFKGLKVIEITEDGVVLGEKRGDTERHVEISILERWANEG